MNSHHLRLPLADAAIAGPSAPSGAVGEGDKLLQVGDIAKASGKTVRAIHHYEDVGLLRPHARSKGRYRLYDQSALARVRWIGKLHDLGLSLAQIQEMVRVWEAAPSAPGAMARIRGLYLQKLEETRAQIAHLATLERELQASIGYLDACEACDPAELVAACSNCNVHDKSVDEPELVAGIHGSCLRPAPGSAHSAHSAHSGRDAAPRTSGRDAAPRTSVLANGSSVEGL